MNEWLGRAGWAHRVGGADSRSERCREYLGSTGRDGGAGVGAVIRSDRFGDCLEDAGLVDRDVGVCACADIRWE